MRAFGFNLAIAVAVMVLTGGLSLWGFVLGAALGYGVLYATAGFTGIERAYFLRVWRTLRLAGFFFWELLLSSVKVAWDVIRPVPRNNPKIIEMPLDVKTDLEILVLTNLISLTPGTLSVDVTEDRSTLIVHAMFADDPEAEVGNLKRGMERMVLEAFNT